MVRPAIIIQKIKHVILMVVIIINIYYMAFSKKVHAPHIPNIRA